MLELGISLSKKWRGNWRVVAHVDGCVALRINVIEIYLDAGSHTPCVVAHILGKSRLLTVEEITD